MWPKVKDSVFQEKHKAVKQQAVLEIEWSPDYKVVLKFSSAIDKLFAIKDTMTLRGPILNIKGSDLSYRLSDCFTIN